MHKLPKEIAAKYACTYQLTEVVLPHPYHVKVDLRSLTMAQADWLHSTGLEVLVLKKGKNKK